jgi:hypothetical protein
MISEACFYNRNEMSFFLDLKVPIFSVLNMVILTGIVGQSREIIFIKREERNVIANSHRINGSLLFQSVFSN